MFCTIEYLHNKLVDKIMINGSSIQNIKMTNNQAIGQKKCQKQNSNSVPKQAKSLNFGAAYSSKGIQTYIKDIDEGLKLICPEGSFTEHIIPMASLPGEKGNNTGSGKPKSPAAKKYFTMIRNIFRADAIKFLPIGEAKGSLKTQNKFFPYSDSSMTIGEHIINLKELTTKKYGEILPKEDFKELVDNHSRVIKEGKIQTNHLKNGTDPEEIEINDKVVHFENELGTDAHTSPVKKLLEKAYKNFKNDTSEKTKPLRDEFNEYLTKNNREENKRLERLHAGRSEDKEFFKFFQFLTDKQLKEGKKENINDLGMKLILDVPINSNDAMKAYPEAFTDKSIGWGMQLLDFDKLGKIENGHLKEDELGTTGELLKDKFKFFAKRGDGLRIDASRQLVQTSYRTSDDAPAVNVKHLGDTVLVFIEDILKKVKKQEAEKLKKADPIANAKKIKELESFDPRDRIFHEIEAGGGDGFGMFDHTQSLVPYGSRTRILTDGHISHGWGNFEAYNVDKHLSRKEIMTGANHDNLSYRDIAEAEWGDYKNHKDAAKGGISRNTGIPEDQLDDSKTFVKGKFAATYNGDKRCHFFSDALGMKKSFKDGDFRGWRTRVGENFEEDLHTNFQDGHALNPAESVSIIMKKRGLDQSHPELYKKITGHAEFLRAHGAKSQAEADELEAKGMSLTYPKPPETNTKETSGAEQHPTTETGDTPGSQDSSKSSKKGLKMFLAALGLGGVAAGGVAIAKNNKKEEAATTYSSPNQGSYHKSYQNSYKPNYTPTHKQN